MNPFIHFIDKSNQQGKENGEREYQFTYDKWTVDVRRKEEEDTLGLLCKVVREKS